MLLAPALESFLAVARAGNVSRAARQLGLSQPAVTKQVQSLERAFGVPLTERAGRGTRLTQAGEIVRGYAQRSAGLSDECRAVLSELGAGRAGSLRLGAGVTTSILALPAWLARFTRQHPGVELAVRTGASEAVTAWVLARELDAGFVTSEPAHPDLVVTQLFDEEIALVVAKGSALRGRVELASVPLILFPTGTGFRGFLDARLAAAGQAPATARIESDSVEACKAFVRAGLGAAYLPRGAVARELASGALRRITAAGVPVLRRRTSLIRRFDRRPSAALRQFMGIVKGA